jgi:inorganic pyrophosphatase/exopolyphosphatase
MMSRMPLLFDAIFKNQHQEHKIALERQINLSRNPNVRHEYFIRGLLAARKNCRILTVSPRERNRLSQSVFNWSYVKCKSRKSFLQAMKDVPEFGREFDLWTCYFFDEKSGLKKMNIREQKKYDDFVDSFLMLRALFKNPHSPPSAEIITKMEIIINRKVFDNQTTKVNIVIGNQSADLDSLVGAILLAAYYNHKDGCSGGGIIPVVNSSREILASKRECMHFLNRFKISLDDLVYIGDLRVDSIASVFLVDHNELDPRELDLHFDDKIKGIIDHHHDARQFMKAKPRIVANAGSNVSLIASLLSKNDAAELGEQFFDMMMYPLVYDTNNLQGPVQNVDREAFKLAKKHGTIDARRLFEELQNARFNTAGDDEPVEQILVKDFKLYDGGKWAMSSVNFCIAEWIKRTNVQSEIMDFMRARNLHFYAILSEYLTASRERRRDFFIPKLKDGAPVFSDENLQETTDPHLFNVKDASLSRKYWQVRLKKYLTDNVFYFND